MQHQQDRRADRQACGVRAAVVVQTDRAAVLGCHQLSLVLRIERPPAKHCDGTERRALTMTGAADPYTTAEENLMAVRQRGSRAEHPSSENTVG